MAKVNPPELKRLMDKKMTSAWCEEGGGTWGVRVHARASFLFFCFLPCRRRRQPAPHHQAPPPTPAHSNPPSLSLSPPHLTVTLNGNRAVSGVLRGFDQFMNLVLDGAVDEKTREDMGMVVLRGASVVTIEALEFVPTEGGGGGGGGA